MLEFREVAGVKVQRPSTDRDDLVPEQALFKGDFEFDLVRIEGGEQAGTTGEGALSHTLVTTVNLSDAHLGPLSLAQGRISGQS